MPDVLPADEQITLLLADDVRQELNNKVSLSGFYPGNEINVKDVGPGIIIPLAFFVMISGGEGAFKLRMNFIDPVGKILFQGPEVVLTKEPKKGTVAMAKVANFPVEMTGSYKVEISLNDRKFEKTFVVGHDPGLLG